jgi:hypothetical protein
MNVSDISSSPGKQSADRQPQDAGHAVDMASHTLSALADGI